MGLHSGFSGITKLFRLEKTFKIRLLSIQVPTPHDIQLFTSKYSRKHEVQKHIHFTGYLPAQILIFQCRKNLCAKNHLHSQSRASHLLFPVVCTDFGTAVPPSASLREAPSHHRALPVCIKGGAKLSAAFTLTGTSALS